MVLAYPLRRWLSATTTEWMHKVGPSGSWPSMDSCVSSDPWQQVPQIILTISPAWLPCVRTGMVEAAASRERPIGAQVKACTLTALQRTPNAACNEG